MRGSRGGDGGDGDCTRTHGDGRRWLQRWRRRHTVAAAVATTTTTTATAYTSQENMGEREIGEGGFGDQSRPMGAAAALIG